MRLSNILIGATNHTLNFITALHILQGVLIVFICFIIIHDFEIKQASHMTHAVIQGLQQIRHPTLQSSEKIFATHDTDS